MTNLSNLYGRLPRTIDAIVSVDGAYERARAAVPIVHSLRVFAAAVSTIMVAAFVTVIPFGGTAHALNGVSSISVDNVTVQENNANGTITFHLTVQPTPSVPFDNIPAAIKSVDATARPASD